MALPRRRWRPPRHRIRDNRVAARQLGRFPDGIAARTTVACRRLPARHSVGRRGRGGGGIPGRGTMNMTSTPERGRTVMTEQTKSGSMARRAFAPILDFLMIFFGAGYAISYAIGAGRPDGFSLQGGPAFICIAIVVLYFVLGHWFGGTLWQRILRVR